MVGQWCKEEDCLLLQTVSAPFSRPYRYGRYEHRCLLTSSQKSLALPPGLTIVVCTQEIVEERISPDVSPCYYLDLWAAYTMLSEGRRRLRQLLV